MSREIKFRAWDGEKMHYPVHENYLSLYNGDNRIPWGIYRQPDGTRIVSGQHEECELMQFTGLLDKNGREIYEGDILRYPPKDNWGKINYNCFEVFFHDGDANSDYNIGYSINRMHNHGSVCGGVIPSFKPRAVSKMVIIGNIHENPEMLEGAK